MATNTYIALIHKDSDSDYGASFPDLPGCVAAASSLDEVLSEAKEALALHIEGMLADGEEVPLPAPADAIDRNDALLMAAIDVPDTLKVEQINMTIPAIALSRFDNFALRQGMTRSALFVEAVNRWIEEDRGHLRLRNTPRLDGRIAALRVAPQAALPAPLATEYALFSIQEALSAGQDEDQESLHPSASELEDQLSNAPAQSEADELIEAISRLVREQMGKTPKVG